MADSYMKNLKAAIDAYVAAEDERFKAAQAANEAKHKILELIGYHPDCDCPNTYLVPASDGFGHSVIYVYEKPGNVSISISRDTELYPHPNFTRCLGNAGDDDGGSLTPCPQRMSCLRFTLPAGEWDETSNRLNMNYSLPCFHYIEDVTVPPAAS